MFTLTARWVFPVDGPPLPWGTVAAEGETITAVEAHGKRRPDEDLGNAALLPGFVNAHTHLDLTGMRGLCPPTPDFPAWLRGVVRHRRQRTPQQIDNDIRTGLAECQRHGTTLIGDISAMGLSWPILEQAEVGAVVFLELLGLPADRAEQAYQQALTWLATHRDTKLLKAGLSPHAPYSVNVELFAALADLLVHQGRAGRDVPLAVHLAESREELELLEERRGPMAEFLRELGVWHPDGLARSCEEIVRLMAPVRHSLWVHANYRLAYASASERRRAEPRKGSEYDTPYCVYCPRTHAAFGHPPHPFQEMLANGVTVALGTDSLASNPDLDILAEARFLHARYPDLPGAALLRMLTQNGADALGFGDMAGSLTPGKSADLVVLPLPADEPADPHRLLFASQERVSKVKWRGNWRKLA